MLARTDDELVAIASCTDDEWVPDAIDAAKRELAKRGIAPERLAAATTKVEEQVVERRGRADERLEAGKAVAVYLLSLLGVVFGLIFIASSTKLARDGFARKAREQRQYAVAGMATLVALIVLVGLFRGCGR